MPKPTIDRAEGELTVSLGSFLPEFEGLASERGFDDPTELLRQHAIKLVCDKRFDEMIASRIIVSDAEATSVGSQQLYRAATRHNRAVIVGPGDGSHANKVFAPGTREGTA